jgi:hypothetical protein
MQLLVYVPQPSTPPNARVDALDVEISKSLLKNGTLMDYN